MTVQEEHPIRPQLVVPPQEPLAAYGMARAGAMVLVGYLVARALGYLRLAGYAAIFGAGPELDAFAVAFRLPDVVLGLVASGALSAAVAVPVAHAIAAGRRDAASATASGLLGWAAVGLAAFGAALFVVAPLVIPLLAPGFGPAREELAVQMAREMAIAPLLLGIGGMVGGILQADRRFGPALLGPIAYNVASLAVAVFLSGTLGAHALSVSVVAGSVAYLVVQLPALRSVGLRIRPSLRLGGAERRRAVGLLGPRAFGLSVDQLKLVLALAAASTLPTGSVTAFMIAATIYQIPAGMLAVPLGTVVVPELATRHVRGATAALGSLVQAALRLTLWVAMPMAAIAVGVAPVVADLLFGHGEYGDAGVALTSEALVVLFLGLPAAAVAGLATRVLFAADRTRPPVGAAILDLAVTGSLLLLLLPGTGLGGIGGAMAAGAVGAAVVLTAVISRSIPGAAGVAALAMAARFAAFAVPAGLVAGVVVRVLLPFDPPPHGWLADTVALVAGGGLGVGLYLGISWLADPRDVRSLRELVGRVRGRASRAAEPVVPSATR